jgi:hypothetical protein
MTEEEDTKTCYGCKETKPRSAFSKCKSRYDGLQADCKACQNAKYRNAPVNAAVLVGTKLCTKCGEEKPRSEFHGRSRSIDGRTSICKPCSKLYRVERTASDPDYNKRRYADNREAQKARSAKYKSKHPERVNAYQRAWYLANSDIAKRATSSWARRHRGECNAMGAKRRSAKLSATPAWVEFDAIVSLYTEARSRSESEGIVYHVDHIVPLQSKLVCGLHCLDNLEILPGKENFSKGNRTWPGQEWIVHHE